MNDSSRCFYCRPTPYSHLKSTSLAYLRVSKKLFPEESQSRVFANVGAVHIALLQ